MTWKIQCQSQETFNKLEVFSLKMTFEQKEHNIPPEKTRLKKDKKEGEDTHPQLIGKRVLIEGSCEGELVSEANEDFEKYEKYKGTDVFNSKRSLIIDINDDIEIPRLTEYEGMNTGNKGRLRVYYSGQSVFCRRCQVTHTARCPKIPPLPLPRDKHIRKQEVTTVILADSQMRLADQSNIKADITCIPGGKIGHLANSLKYEKGLLNEYDNFMIVGGTKDLREDYEADQEFKKETQRGLMKHGETTCDLLKKYPEKI